MTNNFTKFIQNSIATNKNYLNSQTARTFAQVAANQPNTIKTATGFAGEINGQTWIFVNNFGGPACIYEGTSNRNYLSYAPQRPSIPAYYKNLAKERMALQRTTYFDYKASQPARERCAQIEKEIASAGYRLRNNGTVEYAN
jgi:hypothetical protein